MVTETIQRTARPKVLRKGRILHCWIEEYQLDGLNEMVRRKNSDRAKVVREAMDIYLRLFLPGYGGEINQTVDANNTDPLKVPA